MSVDVPTNVSGRRSATAKLTLTFISYREETTDWPDRFSYLTISLEIPSKYTYGLTTLHSCHLCLHVTATGEGLWGHEIPLRLAISPYSLKLEEEVQLIRHTAVFDARGKYVVFHANARFDLEARKSSIFEFETRDEEGDFLIISPAPGPRVGDNNTGPEEGDNDSPPPGLGEAEKHVSPSTPTGGLREHNS